MKKLYITRNTPNHDDLVNLYRKERNSKLKERYQALFLFHEYGNCTKVAKYIKRSKRTIQNWIHAFNDRGLEGLIPNFPPGRPSRLNREQKKALKIDVLKHPRELGYEFSNWEGKNVAFHIERKFNVKIGVRQAQRLLHKLGFTLQRPRYMFLKADSEKQKEFAQNFKKKWILSDQTM